MLLDIWAVFVEDCISYKNLQGVLDNPRKKTKTLGHEVNEILLFLIKSKKQVRYNSKRILIEYI